MASYTDSILIRGLPDAVFAFSTDLAHATEWLPGVAAIERLTPGPVRVGTRYRMIPDEGRSNAGPVVRVSAHSGPQDVARPPYEHAVAIPGLGTTTTVHYTFSSAEFQGHPLKTRVALLVRVEARRWWGRPWVRARLQASRRRTAGVLERLKAAAEPRTAPGSAAAAMAAPETARTSGVPDAHRPYTNSSDPTAVS